MAPEWVKGFRSEIERKAKRPIRSTSLDVYEDRLKVLSDAGVDLQSCTLKQLNDFLDTYRSGHEQSSYRNLVATVKAALRYLNRKDLDENVTLPSPLDRTSKIKDKLIPDEDRAKLIREAPTLRDRILLELLDELGGRRAEIAGLRIRDVQFDEHSAILMLTGKTGTRRRRVYAATPDLRTYLNQHRDPKNPNAPLFYSNYGQPLTGGVLYEIVSYLAKRILGRHIFPHQFRHSAATRDSSYFTDRELMSLYGWSRPEMIAIYSHLSGRNVDDKDLVLHGLKSKEDILRPIVQIQRCPACGQENAPIAIYCSNEKCGKVLGATKDSEVETLKEQVEQLAFRIQFLQDTVQTTSQFRDTTKQV